MDEAAPDALLVGEHFHDYTHDVPGDGWHGVMNYAGFCKPAWTWLRDRGTHPSSSAPRCRCPGSAAPPSSTRCATSRPASPGHGPALLQPRRLARRHADPHPRGRGRQAVDAAAGLLFTFPSMPMLTYGDEIGMEGAFGEDGRRPMPWDATVWDARLLETYRGLIAARKGSACAARGRPALGARRGRHHGLPAGDAERGGARPLCPRRARAGGAWPRHLAGIARAHRHTATSLLWGRAH